MPPLNIARISSRCWQSAQWPRPVSGCSPAGFGRSAEDRMSSVPYIPAGYHSVTPYLAVRDAAAAVEFYRRAFGAELVMKLTMPDGKYAHAEIMIGDSHIMMAEENPEWGNQSPVALGGSPVSFMVYVPDADAAFARALAAGCTQVRPVEDQFYG